MDVIINYKNLIYLIIIVFVAPHVKSESSEDPDEAFINDGIVRGYRSLVQSNDSVEILDGLVMNFPKNGGNVKDATGVVNFKFDPEKFGRGFEGRKGGKGDKKLLRRILPMFILPFLIQSAILPMFLSTLKMMLVKSLLVGKTALLLIIFNALRTSNAFKSRSEEQMASVHYGYKGSGMEEYGVYINRRSMDHF